MKALLIIPLVLASLLTSHAQSTVKENLQIESKILKSPVKYSVYLPEGYPSSKQKYPVLYLLHGYSGDNSDWLHKGNLQRTADALIKKGKLEPTIIIMPDAGNCYYLNSANGKWNYHDMFVKEFVPAIEQLYRIKKENKFRAVAGLSMGGFGATMLALKNPELFGQSASMSGVFWTNERLMSLNQKNFDAWFGKMLGTDLAGEKRINAIWKTFSPLELFSKVPVEQANQQRWYFDCGSSDNLSSVNAKLDSILQARGINHKFYTREGHHNWDYWKANLKYVLLFFY